MDYPKNDNHTYNVTVAAFAVINEMCGKEDPARREKVISAAQAAFARVIFPDGFVFKVNAGDSDVIALFTRRRHVHLGYQLSR